MTELIVGGIGTGKTARLIKECAEKGGHMVVHSHEEACRVVKYAESMGFNIPFPLTYSEFIKGSYHARGVKKFHIDNAESLIHFMTRTPIASMSIGTDQKTTLI